MVLHFIDVYDDSLTQKGPNWPQTKSWNRPQSALAGLRDLVNERIITARGCLGLRVSGSRQPSALL